MLLPLTVPVIALGAFDVPLLFGKTQVESPLVIVMAIVSAAVISANATFVHVAGSGSAANTAAGSNDTTITSASSREHQRLRCFLILFILL